jgi:hypothetical protein
MCNIDELEPTPPISLHYITLLEPGGAEKNAHHHESVFFAGKPRLPVLLPSADILFSFPQSDSNCYSPTLFLLKNSLAYS